ncbi:MAG: rRNA maturation RNase YbeY [Candidatus Paceibacterota bacterium]|jgi:probable rRNA maturation factor
MQEKVPTNFEIIFKEKGNLARKLSERLPFLDTKNAVLGKEYDLCLTFVDKELIQELNNTHRKIDRVTDILSFPLSKNSGEIFICLESAKEEAPKFDREFENFISFLFIHGLCHLNGMAHSSKMESTERKFREKFGI